nr:MULTISPECIES: formate dehydrogenase accessory protein FdhE [unclassified Luteimonas]
MPRGEIENLDHTRIPRLRIPERAGVFSDRATRLRQLAASSTVGDYLLLMARLADAQQRALKVFIAPEVDAGALAEARRHDMPPLPATSLARDPAWRAVLAGLLDEVASDPGTPAQAVEACTALARALDAMPERVEQIADGLLAGRVEGADVAPAPFVMAALQVYWTAMASGLQEAQLPVGAFGLCPTCGTPPVASVVRIGGAHDGYRYLCCPLCSCEWHLERVKCSHCAGTRDIAYHYIEGGREGVKAETCDGCRSYRKIFYQDTDPFMEPVADDLGSLALDMLMGDEAYARRSGNPLLWQDSGD